jgi:hypothetical protein
MGARSGLLTEWARGSADAWQKEWGTATVAACRLAFQTVKEPARRLTARGWRLATGWLAP